MSADFWAGYLSGAAGIIIGNPLDLIKVRLQAGGLAPPRPSGLVNQFESLGALVKGASAPILGYGALNALLFVSYHHTLTLLCDDYTNPSSAWKTWVAGATGGLATWVVSTPTELVKCRAQVAAGQQTSWSVAKELMRMNGPRGLYVGGGVTSLRDSIGYGFYFWSYELSKGWMTVPDESDAYTAAKVLICGGLAGMTTWASIYPLVLTFHAGEDVIKSRVQTQLSLASAVSGRPSSQTPLMQGDRSSVAAVKSLGRLSTLALTRQAYEREGLGVFVRGLGVCTARAFIVNAVQWSVYEYIMRQLKPAS
ncbi:MAG: hypothetical protein M1838_004621 [Thelocarpon superellum]|nr:MAG: hypothetical protein M1838_004621 [Thelocarpon superellum]